MPKAPDCTLLTGCMLYEHCTNQARIKVQNVNPEHQAQVLGALLRLTTSRANCGCTAKRDNFGKPSNRDCSNLSGARIFFGIFLGFFWVFFLVLCCFWQFGSTPPPFVSMWQPPDHAWPPGRPFTTISGQIMGARQSLGLSGFRASGF